jgi:hypothetical protein
VEVRTVGNKTWRWWFVGVLLGVLSMTGAGWSQEAGARDSRLSASELVVAVYDDAGVEAEIVRQAEVEAERVFQAAGIEVRWRNVQWERGTGLTSVTAGEISQRLTVRIVPHSRDLPGEIFGLAFIGDDGRGRQADVFYDGIARLSVHGSHDPAVLLGAVMAHELGHLLLGSNSHSATGIMRGRWDKGDLQRAALGKFGFGAEQGVKMRERVASDRTPEEAVMVEAAESGEIRKTLEGGAPHGMN